jgi:hypothetical protein
MRRTLASSIPSAFGLMRRGALMTAFLLAIQLVSFAEARAAKHVRQELLTQDLTKLCQGEGASREQALVDQRQDACLGYIKGVADVLQSSGAVGTCAVSPAIGEVFAALSRGEAGYDLEDHDRSSRMVARLLISSCRRSARP